jgi:pimeloyl-ACP methyl ester carboxylesterase
MAKSPSRPVPWPVTNVERRLVRVRGGAFSVDVVDAGAGAPLLYLHGEWGRSWDDVLAQLAQSRRVIAPCHPGYGETTGTEELLDVHDLIYYYLDFLDTLDLRDVSMIGHGLGGMIAAELAAVQPERFTRLVLIAPLGLWNPADPVLDFFSADPDTLARALYHDPESLVARAAMETPKEGEPYVQYMLERAKSLATAAKYLWPIPNRGLSKRLHRVRTPTLLAWGKSDGICSPFYGEEFQARITGSNLVVLEGAGHMPQAERPREVADAIQTFLSQE